MQQRSTAIESIEATISELGQMFGQLAHMVAAQHETVQRIDADVLQVGTNVSAAQNELLRFYNNVRSNRTMMLKIFAVSSLFPLTVLLSLGCWTCSTDTGLDRSLLCFSYCLSSSLEVLLVSLHSIHIPDCATRPVKVDMLIGL